MIDKPSGSCLLAVVRLITRAHSGWQTTSKNLINQYLTCPTALWHTGREIALHVHFSISNFQSHLQCILLFKSAWSLAIVVEILTVSVIHRKQIKGKRGKKRKTLRLLWPVANTAPHRIKLTVCISIARHLIKATKSSRTLTRPFMYRLLGVLTYSNGWQVLTNKACDRQVLQMSKLANKIKEGLTSNLVANKCWGLLYVPIGSLLVCPCKINTIGEDYCPSQNSRHEKPVCRLILRVSIFHHQQQDRLSHLRVGTLDLSSALITKSNLFSSCLCP